MAPVLRPSSCVALALLVACVPTEKPKAEQRDAGALQRPPLAQRRTGAPEMPRPASMQPTNAEPMARSPSLPAPPAAATADLVPPERDALLREPFHDLFERGSLGDDFRTTSPVWRIQGGRLCGRGARNHPVWLKRRLPANARIEFDATSSSNDGDLKVELWGDGKSFAQSTSYTNASSYLAIFGGWKNQFHVLARIDEHAPGRPEVRVDPSGGDLRAQPVKAGQTYHFKIERSDGKTVRWLVDDIEIHSFSDPAPLKGTGHDHIGFNDWEVPVCFDNLSITPLEGG
jgi:hypothetical protein